ncbi:MAG: flavodoxin family protein [Pseudomonadota bacterium]
MSDPAPLPFMPKKTLSLLGSPRRGGNSDVLADAFCARAHRYEAVVDQFALAELDFDGCRNLFRCKTDLSHCGQSDGLSPILDQIALAEVLVLASPIYFTNVTGQLKSAIDRLFSFFVPNYAIKAQKSRLCSGRKVVLIQTQGEPEGRYGDLLESYATGFAYLGFDQAFHIRAWGVREPGDLDDHPEFFERCHHIADQVYGG